MSPWHVWTTFTPGGSKLERTPASKGSLTPEESRKMQGRPVTSPGCEETLYKAKANVD